MKIRVFTLIFLSMGLFMKGQNFVYDKDGNKKEFEAEDIDIIFETSGIQKTGTESVAILSILPTVVDVAFGLTTKALEKRVEKFTSEYTKKKSHLQASSGVVPDFKFVRKIKINTIEKNALNVQFKTFKVSGINGFVYYIAKIELAYSAAKFKSSSKNLDYVIEIKPTLLLQNGETHTLESGDIVISSVNFGNNDFTNMKHRSSIMSLPDGAVLTEVNVKIVETNPAKTRAEKILSLWNDNKENVKTIVKEFIPEEKEEDEEDKDENDNKNQDQNDDNNGDENESDGNK